MTRVIRYGANFKIVGKTDPQNLSHTGAWEIVEGGIAGLAAHIGKGHPWMPALLDGNGKRWQTNANTACVLALDVDGGMTLEETRNHPFIRQYAALIIESASSTPEFNKFRIVFVLPSPVQGWQTIRNCNIYLAEQVGHADPACKDASRYFFGAPGRSPFLLNESATLPDSFVEDAQAWQAEQERKAQAEYEARVERYKNLVDSEPEKLELVRSALQYGPRREPGCGNYGECIAIAGALKDEFGDATAIALLEEFIPPHHASGDKWNPEKVVRSLGRGIQKASLGRVFYVAQQNGWRFPKREHDTAQVGEPSTAEYNAYCQWERERERLEQAQAREDGQRRLEQQLERRSRYLQETERIQSRLNSLDLTPTIELSGDYIPYGAVPLPEQSGIIIIEAPKNSGKTANALKGLVEEHRRLLPNSPRVSKVPRNTLGKQSGKKLGLPHHEDLARPSNEMTACLESIHKDSRNMGDRPLAIYDEPSQTFRQNLEGHTSGDAQAFVITRFLEQCREIKRANGWIVLSEDHISNIEVEAIKTASGMDVIEYLKFNKNPVPRDIQVYTSSSVTWDEMLIRLERGENLVLFSDSAEWLRETERKLIDEGVPGVWIIDRESIGEPWAQEFCKEPDEWAKVNRPRVLGFSPSISSGVSIDDKAGHFQAIGFHIVHLHPNDASQMGMRLRTQVPMFGYVKESASTDNETYSSCRPEVILRDLDRNKKGIAKLTNFAEYAAQQDVKNLNDEPVDLLQHMQELQAQASDITTPYGFYRHFYAQYKAKDTWGKLALRDNLIELWRSEGHNVSLVDLGCIKHLKEERQEIRVRLDREEAQVFAQTDAGDITVRDAHEILRSNATRVQKRKARKAIALDKLPGCNLDDERFVHDVLIKNRGKFLRGTELLWLRQNPKYARILDRWSWGGKYAQSARRGEFVVDHKLSIRSGQAQLLNDCPLEPFIDGTVEQWDADTPEVIAVHQWALLHARPIKRYLRLTIKPEHSPVKAVNKLLKKMEYALLEDKAGSGKRQKIYSIDRAPEGDRQAILDALTARFIQKANAREEQLSDDTSPTRISILPLQVGDAIGEPPPLDEWLTPEAQAEIRQILSLATDPEIRRIILEAIPAPLRARFEEAVA